MNGRIKRSIQMVLLIVMLLTVSIAYAGGSIDQGQLVGTPVQANYIVWVNTGSTPSQVLTEDGYNSESGVNQGYQSQTWIFSATNFSAPPTDMANISMIFGGLGADIGDIWTYDFIYDNDEDVTNHGTVGTQAAGNCPVMTQGSQDDSGKTINWTGSNVQHLIYRSQNPSGAGNGASNGRYNFVTVVGAGTYTYLDTTCVTGVDCWHVVIPGNGSGIPNGCHSEESNPTAITLTQFTATNAPANSWALWVGVGVSLMALAGLAFVWNRRRA